MLALGSVLAGGVLDLQVHAGVAPSSAHGASAARRLVDQEVRWPTSRRARESASDVRTFASDENFFNFFHNFYLGMHCR